MSSSPAKNKVPSMSSPPRHISTSLLSPSCISKPGRRVDKRSITAGSSTSFPLMLRHIKWKASVRSSSSSFNDASLPGCPSMMLLYLAVLAVAACDADGANVWAIVDNGRESSVCEIESPFEMHIFKVRAGLREFSDHGIVDTGAFFIDAENGLESRTEGWRSFGDGVDVGTACEHVFSFLIQTMMNPE
ncbi:hypothetical protein GQ43DRAFT_79919 [Delitschia confertaspora ATCC 74209]|uniref:Uncharacterized protein n=1 Tax=Delitschia confertaspora ATCC 74209 TaxID=1513339 RepID=A0A9P4JJI3_9PLEO|nr:hypothetical protein GQ43DRAFT_79919 [Delitschia confertaspora ATCC 74209]